MAHQLSCNDEHPYRTTYQYYRCHFPGACGRNRIGRIRPCRDLVSGCLYARLRFQSGLAGRYRTAQRRTDRYEIIDIGSHVKYLKEFLRIRDNSPVFNEAKKIGTAGIPCFVLEDGSITLIPEEAGLTSRPITEGMSCNIDGSGC